MKTDINPLTASDEVLLLDNKVLTAPDDPKKLWKMQISKTLPVLELVKSDLTLNQLKIIDLYLACVDSRNTENSVIRISSRQLAQLFHVSQINSEYMKTLVDGLSNATICSSNKSKTAPFFSIARYCKDQFGVNDLLLGCSEAAKEHVFFQTGTKYLKTKIFFISNLKRRSSFALYYYLLNHGFITIKKYLPMKPRTIEVPIDKLREALHAVEKSYAEFKRFNNLFLKPATKEINEKTDIRFDYSIVKRGRTAVAIRFKIACRLPWAEAMEDIEAGVQYESRAAEQYADAQEELEWQARYTRSKITEDDIREHYDISQNPSQEVQAAIDRMMEERWIIAGMEADRKEFRRQVQRRCYAQKSEAERLLGEQDMADK